MRTAFSAKPEPARHETVEGILSPEGLCLLWSRGVAAHNADTGAALAQQHQCTSQKIVEGMEPGEVLPLALKKIVMSITWAGAE